jgi:hypothetical protein
VEYLRWLQLQSHLFLRPAYTLADIAEIVDKYDELTRHSTIQPECALFENYVVNIFRNSIIYRF